MQGNWAKVGLVISAVLMLGLFAGFIVETIGGGSIGGGGGGDVWMVCTNPDCGAKYELSSGEFRQLAGPMTPMGPAQTVFECKECGQQTAYVGMQCPKCGEVFIRGSASQQYPDKCPACGYSRMEDFVNR